MGLRREGREMALKALYLADACRLSRDQALGATLGEPGADSSKKFCRHLVAGVLEHREEIDRLLSNVTENWEIGRMAVVDRNILRLSAYEILRDLETPISVIIDEAIEIAKAYSTEDSGKFVNGILDKIKKERKSPLP